MNQIYYQIYLKEDVTEKISYGKYHQNNKSNRNKVNQTNIEARNISIKLKIDDRAQEFLEAEAFFILKDDKDNFLIFLTFRFINPSKSETGKIIKSILDKINNALVEKTIVIP